MARIIDKRREHCRCKHAVLHTPTLPSGAAVASKYAFITMNARVAIARISVECGVVAGNRVSRAIESGGRLTSINLANDSCCYGLKSVPPQRGQGGSVSVSSSSVTVWPQPVQRYVPLPGFSPVVDIRFLSVADDRPPSFIDTYPFRLWRSS